MCNCKASKMGAPCANRTDNSIVTVGARAPDSMRHGGLNFEVVGSDRARAPRARDAAIDIQQGATNPLTNQAGALTPLTSATGQALQRNAARFVRMMDPIEYVRRFGNNVGVNRAQSSRNISVVADPGYDGILPLSQQPKINKPYPYKDG